MKTSITGPKSKCWQGQVHSRGSRGDSLSLPAPAGCQHSLAFLASGGHLYSLTNVSFLHLYGHSVASSYLSDSHIPFFLLFLCVKSPFAFLSLSFEVYFIFWPCQVLVVDVGSFTEVCGLSCPRVDK